MSRLRIAVTTALVAAALALAANGAPAAPAAKSATARPAAKPVLPFIEDDYPRALERARQAKLPVFIESWAPW